MSKFPFFFMLVFVFLLSSPGWANVNVNGTTGLVVVPSAVPLKFKDINLGGHVGKQKDAEKAAFNYFAQIGAFKGLEASMIGGSNTEGNFREGVFINLKYSLQSGRGRRPLRIAMGVENLTSNQDTDIFMVFTKTFKGRLDLTAGFLADFPGDRFRPMGALGLQYPLFEGFHVIVDGLAGESMVQGNAGATLTLNQDFILRVLGVNLFDHPEGRGERSVFYGFSWKNPF